MRIAILVSLLLVQGSRAQDVSMEASKTATEANGQQQRKLETSAKPKKAPGETTVTYSGFLVDLSRAEKPSRMLSLRQPRNLTNDYRNVYLDERTARPKGFVLFSLSF